MRKIVAIIVAPMNLFGLNPLKEDTFLGCYLRITLVCFALAYGLCSTFLLFLQSEGNVLNSIVKMVPYSSSWIMFISVIISAQLCKSSTRYTLTSMNNGVFTYPDEDNFYVEYKGYLSEGKLKKALALVILLEMGGFIISGLSPFIMYLLVDKLELHFYPQWVPWRVESTLDKILAYSLQCPIVFIVFVVHNLTQIYFTFAAVEFLRQYKRLQYAIETLDERSRRNKALLSKMDKLSRGEYDTIFGFNLTMCIQHHQNIIKLFKKFKIFYQIEYSLELYVMTFSFTFLLFSFVEKTDPIFVLNMMGVAYVLITNLFSRCFIGEQFSEMNSRIQNALFHDLNWYDQSAKNKNLILTFHCGTRPSLVLKGFGVFNASYYVYSAVIRSSYTYFNLLRASTKR